MALGFGSAHAVQRAVSFLLEIVSPGPGKIKLSAVVAGFGAGQITIALKLLRWVADYTLVRRSALIGALSFALGGAVFSGIGEWAAGRLETPAESGSSRSVAISPGYEGSRAAPAIASPALPESGSYLPASSPDYTLRHDVPEVRVQFTAADQHGRLIQDLTASDVRILDDQSPVPRFSDFERDDNLPLRLGLILDTSDSVRRVLTEEKVAAINFLDRVMHPQGDTALVMAFGADMRVWQTPTADRQQLAEAVAHAKQPGWGTRFYDALYSACASQLSGNEDAAPVHRAIVVLSDGDDTESLHTLEDVIGMAERSEVQIYALTLRPKKTVDRGDQVLQRLADATGGRVYFAPSSKDFAAAFAQIEQDLRTQYLVSFPPRQSKPGFHSLRVEVRAPQKLEIHARQGYYALAQ